MKLPSNTKTGIENNIMDVDPNITGFENIDNQETDGQASDDQEGETQETDGQTTDGQDNSLSAEAAPNANIVFVGDGEPITKINNGMETIKLPPVVQQAIVKTIAPEKENEVETIKYTGIPFFHKNAGAIIQLFPNQYKRFVKKGE